MRLALQLLHSKGVSWVSGTSLLVAVRGNRAPDLDYGFSWTEAYPNYRWRANLAARLAAIPGIDDLSLSTNATRLHALAAPLKETGVRRVNVSLDSLRADRVAAICGRDVLDKILAGLAAAKNVGFTPIKINMVAMRGVNDDEIDDMVDFCIEQGFVLRLIEAMPMGTTGRNTQFLDLQPIRRRLQQERGLVAGDVPGGGPARYMKAPDGRFSIGFITALSEPFCATCNRVRLAADGTM